MAIILFVEVSTHQVELAQAKVIQMERLKASRKLEDVLTFLPHLEKVSGLYVKELYGKNKITQRNGQEKHRKGDPGTSTHWKICWVRWVICCTHRISHCRRSGRGKRSRMWVANGLNPRWVVTTCLYTVPPTQMGPES